MTKKEPNISHLRLINGDEIICEVVKNTAKDITIRQPMVVSEKTDNKTKSSVITMSKYIMYNGNTDSKIQKPHIVTISPVLDQIRTFYYNSVEYNARFVEPSVLDQLAYINEIMEQTLTDPGDGFDEIMKIATKSIENETSPDKKIKTIFIPANNSIH